MTTRRSSPDGSTLDEPALRITGPGDLVQLVPYLLGFHPTESLVIIGLARGRVVVTVRMDLADLAVDGVLAGTVAAMADGGAEDLVGAVFDDRAIMVRALARPTRCRGTGARRCEVEAERIGAAVGDVLLVSSRRWWSFCCPDDLRCCPPEGHPLDDKSSAVPAAAAYAGLVALPDREALAETLAPEPAALRERLLPRLDEAQDALRAAADGGRAERSSSGPCSRRHARSTDLVRACRRPRTI